MVGKLRQSLVLILIGSAFTWTVSAQDNPRKAKPDKPAPKDEDKSQDDSQSSGPPTVGKKAPMFKATTLGGEQVSLADGFKGKLVLVDFWATWCPPCREEIPHLVKAYEDFHNNGLEIVSISLDKPQQVSADKVKDFVKKNKMTWGQVYENVEKIRQNYGVRTIPSAFLVDGDTGLVVAMGNELRGKNLSKVIEKHLKKKKP